MRTRITRPPLTAEQEIELARRVHGRDRADALRARDELVLHNFGLAGKIVGNVAKVWPDLDYDDLFGEAMVALVRVADRYNPKIHHARFATYAIPDLKGRLGNYARKKQRAAQLWRGDCVDPEPAPIDKIINIEEINAILEAFRELDPRKAYIVARRFGLGESQATTLEEIARELGCTREYVRQLEAKALAQLSIRSRSKFSRSLHNMSI